MAALERFDVTPPDAFSEDNPYTAQVVMVDKGRTGTIRITPPCWFGRDYLDTEAGNMDVRLSNQRSGGESTVLSYTIYDDGAYDMTYRERVRDTTKSLLCALGEVANPDLVYGL